MSSALQSLLSDTSGDIGGDAVKRELARQARHERLKELYHVKCALQALQKAESLGKNSAPSYSATYNLSVSSTWEPNRDANPADLMCSHGTPTYVEKQAGAIGCDHSTSKSPPAAIFPNQSDGIAAANDLYNNYAQSSHGSEPLGALVNQWSPTAHGQNPHAYYLTMLGMDNTYSMADPIDRLTSAQRSDFLAAFAWSEGYRPLGC